MPNTSRTYLRRLVLLSAIPILFVAFVVTYQIAIESIRNAQENDRREWMRKQIADVLSGASDHIYVTSEIDEDEFSFDELVMAKDQFDEADDFALDIMYSQNVDALLKRLSGIRGVTKVYFHNTDVTDAGMNYVATFPQLKELILERGGITDKGIDALRDCQLLEELFIEPYKEDAVSIPVVLSLPNLRKLTVQSPEKSSWVRDNLHHFKQATQLEKLKLVDQYISDKDLESLQSHLVVCEIELIEEHER